MTTEEIALDSWRALRSCTLTGHCWPPAFPLGSPPLPRWAGEAGHTAAQRVKAVAAICSPLDLAAGGRAIGKASTD